MLPVRRAVVLLSRSAACSCRRLNQTAAVEKWQLMTAVQLERPPVVTAPLTPIEAEYASLLDMIEVEGSSLSGHEQRHLEDLRLTERRKQDDDSSKGESIRQTALDVEDIWDHEAKQFTPASRTTEADQNGDLQTTNRALDKRLVLLVKQSLGDSENWVLPQGSHLPGETMRQSAERVLKEVCGEEVKATFMGNAPVAVFKCKYAQPTEDGCTGAKVFFFKALFNSGTVDSPQIPQHMWLHKNELKPYLSSSYHKKVSHFMLDI